MTRRATLLALLAAALLPLTARAQTITAAPGGNMTSLVGMPFDVPFYVDMTARPEKLGAFAARVQWNPAVLKLDDGSDGSFGAVTVGKDSLAAGVAHIAGANPAGVGGMLTLGILHFTALVAQADTIRLTVTQLFAAGSFADLLPSLTTRSGFFCPARGMFGDVDKDGSINSRDALIALSNAVGLDVSAFDITLGDVDANGATNARDALIILSSAVGLPVTGFQVGRLAGGACSTNLPLAMTIVPDTVDMQVGQTVAFEARAADSSGVLQTVTNAIWKSGNSSALAVLGDGTALARDTGTVRVTAIRASLDSAQAVVRIVARRTRHIVDAGAATAKNQLGSAAFPFAHINQGIGFAQAGDTVEVRVGRYAESVQLDRQVLLTGDTLPDGTRPLIALDTANSYAGLLLLGAGIRQAENLGIGGYYEAVDVYGPSHVVLRGLRSTGTFNGVVIDSVVGMLLVQSSRLVGAGLLGDAYGVETNAVVDTLVLQGSEISDFANDGVYAPYADSIAVLGSSIHDVGEYGIYVFQSGCEGNCFFGRPVALTMSGSTIARTGSYAVYLDPMRSAWFSHNHLSNPTNGYGVEVYGVYGRSGAWARFVGDSMDVYEDWLYAEYLDSLTVDSAWVKGPYPDGYAYDVTAVRMTNSQFTNANGYALEVNFGGPQSTGQVFLDNVSVVGDPACDLCAEVLEAYGPRVTANRITGVNLDDGLYVSGDSSLTLTNSFFQHVYYAVEWYGSSADSTSRLTVTHTTFNGFYEAIEATSGGLFVDSSTFQNGQSEGIYWYGYNRIRVSNNSFASVGYPLELEQYQPSAVFSDTITDNVITDLAREGIYFYGADSVPVQILRNSATCNAAGASGGEGIYLGYASGAVTANQILGCSTGIYVYDDNGSNGRADSVLGNSVTMPGRAYEGIYVEGSIKSRIANNAVTGDTAGVAALGDIYVYGYQPGATSTIDSNTVTGGSNAGIYVTYLDTALVRFNTVQGVKAPSTTLGGIVAGGGLTYLAQIFGNSVRNVYGNGMRLYSYYDTAMVQVDSNLVTGSSADGIRVEGGADSITRNLITNNRIGLEFANTYFDQNRSLVSENNIVKNPFGLYQGLDPSVNATNNWWGDTNGPQHNGSEGTAGDSVYGASFSPWATTPLGNTPSPAAPARPVVALRAPSFHAVRGVAPTGLNAPVALKARVQRAAAPTQAGHPPAGQARVPAGLKPAQAAAWQRTAQLRVAGAAAAAQHTQVRAARVQARGQAQQALAQRVEQQKARHEARLKAKQARQAAARAGLPTHGVRQ